MLITGFGYSMEVNILVAGLILPADQLAIYNITYRIVELTGFLQIALSHQFAPHASRYYGQNDIVALQRLVARVTLLRFWAAVGTLIALIFVGRQLLGLVGEEFVIGYHALLILTAAKLIPGALGPLIVLAAVTGQQNRCALIFPCATGVGVILSALLIPRFGMEGGAIAVLLATLILNAWLYAVLVKRVKIEPSLLSLCAAFPRAS
jgi:O-antigen/teichoic acid export membrane protein